MKKFIMLMVVCLMCVNCYGVDLEQPEYKAPWMSRYHDDVMSYFDHFSPSPIIEYVDGKHSQHINDFGHEFVVKGWNAGTYWEAGAYGEKNGYTDYYGNTYWTPKFHTQGYCLPAIPEPTTIAFLAMGSLFLVRRRK